MKIKPSTQSSSQKENLSTLAKDSLEIKFQLFLWSAISHENWSLSQKFCLPLSLKNDFLRQLAPGLF